MYEYLTSMNRKIKTAIILSVDLFLVVFSLFTAFILRLNDPWPIEWFMRSLDVMYIMIVSTIVLTFLLRLHLKKLGSFDFESATDLSMLVVLVTIIGFSTNLFFKIGAPRTTPLIGGAILLISVFGFRFLALNLLRALEFRNSNRVPVIVYGAGAAGSQLAVMLRNSKQYKPVVFIDDNPHLQGLNISGLRVYKPEHLEKLVAKGKVKEILLAMPSLKAIQRNKIIKSLLKTGCKVQEVPAYEEVIKSGDLIASLRVVNPEELLGRNNVDIEMSETDIIYRNANVLVSGGGGSIGSELCRKIMKIKPRSLVILEMSELSLFNIERELEPFAAEQGIKLVSVLGSVCDELLLTKLFKENDIKVVLHAAAYKHVPLIEGNIIEGIKNNILGTKIIAETAVANGVERFTLISTDKAVRPTSIMGATKRIAELVLQDLHDGGAKCTFSMVRFGNVLGSSGSVIPLFKQQIKQGGPVTVTHQDVTRYFMTIPEAAQLVLLASSFAEGGEVYVLDMGEPVKIIELAQRMIELSGYTICDDKNPDGDIEIKISGLRPGEKLYEELLVGENTLPTPHPMILRARERLLPSKQLKSIYNRLEKCTRTQNSIQAKQLLFDAITKCDKAPIVDTAL